MKDNSKNRKLAGVLAALVVAFGIVLWTTIRTGRPQPNNKGYYRGAMLNKAGTAYTDDEGHTVPTPPGAPEPKGHIPGGAPPSGAQ